MSLTIMHSHLIVNADDFGLNDKVTSAILECFRHGWITQTTLLVNMPNAEEAVKRALADGFGNKVGLHLNFTEGVPLTDPIKEFDEICDNKGCFKRHRAGLDKIVPFESARLRDAIRMEVRAQVERYCSFHLPLMHCDGHHHVHNRPQFIYEVLPILKEYGFKSVRNRYTVFLKYGIPRHPLKYIRGRLSQRTFDDMVRSNGLSMTDGFGAWEGSPLSKWRRFNSFELMVHPDYDSCGRNVNVLDFAARSVPEMRNLKLEIDRFLKG